MQTDGGCCAPTASRKRKFPLDDLNQDLLERVLSWLPTSVFFRLTSVCKRWKSIADSATFQLACSQIPSRDPWFFMVDPHLNQWVVFDSAERNWKTLNHPPLLQLNPNINSIPVAAHGGLICFRNSSGHYIVCNPVTGSTRQLPLLDKPPQNQSLHAIAMNSFSTSHHSYKLVLVYGELSSLTFRIYNSSVNLWEEEIRLSRKAENPENSFQSDPDDDDETVYFLSITGNVVATNMQRSPSKQYSSYPKLLPALSEYSIDIVESKGELLVVVLSEFLETASLRVWKFDEDTRAWRQIAAMPPAMSHEFYGKKVDINCAAAGHQILICINSGELCRYILCDLVANQWIELPQCIKEDEAKEFIFKIVSDFSNLTSKLVEKDVWFILTVKTKRRKREQRK
ncbi:unnamed protein product, partial [Vitis vinifera]